MRAAGPADIESALALSLEGLAACGLERTPINHAKARASCQAVLNSANNWKVLIEAAGEPVGYAHGFLADNWHLTQPSANLTHMYIREGHRSPALFRQVVDDFAEWARGKGADAVVAYLVNGQAGPAVDRLWRRAGFGPPVGSIYERWL